MTQGGLNRFVALQDPGQDYLHRMLCGPTVQTLSIELRSLVFHSATNNCEYSTALCSVNRPLHVTVDHQRHCNCCHMIPFTINFDIEKDWDPSYLIFTQDGGSVTRDILPLSIVNDCTKSRVKWNKGKETHAE